jgi:4-hydroxy-3-methylbut-2-enyl diphosphate reductase
MTEERDELSGIPEETAPTAETPSSTDETVTETEAEDIQLEEPAQAEAAAEESTEEKVEGPVAITAEESDPAASERIPDTVMEAAPVAKAGDQARPRGEETGSSVDYSHTFRTLSQGDVVGGVVVHIDKEGVLVDVGTKSEGIIRPHELSVGPIQAAEDVVSVGERIDVYVMQTETEDGTLLLSKKRADFEKAWDRVQQAHEEGKVLTAMVSDRVKGGLVVDLGIRGFVPGSHVGNGKVKNLDRYVGQSLPIKVIEVDRDRRKVVLSHRLALEQERHKQREVTIAGLIEGQIREGAVRRLTDYGAFVDLGGIDGLLHVSEMSWTRINHPSEVVKPGQRIHVMILKLNLEAGRVSLGLRQILPDPWVEIAGKYRVGQLVSGAVSRLVPFGAFVQLEGGIEAIIPNTELSQRRVKRPEDVVSVGETVEAKVIDIRPEERRMTLSVRQIHEDRERREYDSYQASRSNGNLTLGDLVGEKLQELASSAYEAEAETVEVEETASAVEIEEPEVAAAPEVEAKAVEVAEAVEEVSQQPAPKRKAKAKPKASVEAESEAPPEAAEEAQSEEDAGSEES